MRSTLSNKKKMACVSYLNEMLKHIRNKEQLSKVSKEVGKKYGVSHDLIYYAQFVGYIKRVGKGEYKSNVGRFHKRDVDTIYAYRTDRLSKDKKARESSTQLSLFKKKVVVSNIVEGKEYKHPKHGLVKVDEIISDSLAYVLVPISSDTHPKYTLHEVRSNLLSAVAGSTTVKKEKPSKEILNLGVRARNCLKSANINTAEELSMFTESQISNVPNTGRKTIDELEKFLQSKGLKFSTEPINEPLISDRDKQIIECINNKEKVDDIAAKFDVHKSSISNIAKKHGISIGSLRKKERSDLLSELKSELKNGMSKADAELKYKKYPKFIKFIRAYFITFNNKKRIADRNNKIVSLYKEDYTLKNISELTDLGVPTIAAIIRDNKAYKFPEMSISIPEKKKRTEELFEYVSSLKSQYKMTAQQIAEELNENGYKTLRGTEYTVGNVTNMFYKANNGLIETTTKKSPKKVAKKTDDYLSSYIKKFKK
jgi:hypothetical protein